jgi:hypothetical protein
MVARAHQAIGRLIMDGGLPTEIQKLLAQATSMLVEPRTPGGKGDGTSKPPPGTPPGTDPNAPQKPGDGTSKAPPGAPPPNGGKTAPAPPGKAPPFGGGKAPPFGGKGGQPPPSKKPF